MKKPEQISLPSLVLLLLAMGFGCKEKNNAANPDRDCGYTITITEGGKTTVTYTNNCANNNIGQSDGGLLMVLSSPDTKYALAINITGITEGDYTVKNEPPYGKGVATLFLTSDQSKIPGALSFAQGKVTVSRFKSQTADGAFNATATSAINKKTYTLTGEFKNMPVKNH